MDCEYYRRTSKKTKQKTWHSYFKYYQYSKCLRTDLFCFHGFPLMWSSILGNTVGYSWRTGGEQGGRRSEFSPETLPTSLSLRGATWIISSHFLHHIETLLRLDMWRQTERAQLQLLVWFVLLTIDLCRKCQSWNLRWCHLIRLHFTA